MPIDKLFKSVAKYARAALLTANPTTNQREKPTSKRDDRRANKAARLTYSIASELRSAAAPTEASGKQHGNTANMLQGKQRAKLPSTVPKQ